MRVLLVEDEEDLGLAIKQVLVSEKYVVDWAINGNQAWKLFATWMVIILLLYLIG